MCRKAKEKAPQGGSWWLSSLFKHAPEKLTSRTPWDNESAPYCQIAIISLKSLSPISFLSWKKKEIFILLLLFLLSGEISAENKKE